MTDEFDAFFTFAGGAPRSPRRPCILLVSHDASRTGAPLTLLWLAEAIRQDGRFDVRILTLADGPLLGDFARVAPLCSLRERSLLLGVGGEELVRMIADQFASLGPRGLAVCNTAVIPDCCEAFARAGADVLTLIHELPAFFDTATMARIVRSSNHVGVYSEWNSARYTGPYAIPAEKLVITPPVLPHLATSITTAAQRRVARRAIGVSDDALMVLGVGYVHPAKGSDWFVRIAAQCAGALAAERLAFRWIGGDADAVSRPAVLRDIAALGLADVVMFTGAQTDPWPWYRAADVFACTSRWEAMGVSIIEAMSAGLPVVTFAEAGASRFIAQPADVVAPYDLDAFSARILAHLTDPALRARVGASGHQRVRAEFGDASLPPGLRAILDGVATQ